MRGRKRKYRRKPYKPIDTTDFKDLRLMNSLTIEQAADMLHVTPRTVISWEKGRSRIPYSAYKLFRLMANGEFMSGKWEGWQMRGDTLYSPVGRAFQPHELYYLSHYIRMARYWMDDCLPSAMRARVYSIRPKLKLVVTNQGEIHAAR